MTLRQLICAIRYPGHVWAWSSTSSLTCDRCKHVFRVPCGSRELLSLLAEHYGKRLVDKKFMVPSPYHVPRRDPVVREFIGGVKIVSNGDFGTWDPGGPCKGLDMFVITHVRVVSFKPRTEHIIPLGDFTLRIGREFFANLGSLLGVDRATCGADSNGWIKLRYAAVIKHDAFSHEIFLLQGPVEADLRLDVIANICAEHTL